MRGSTLQTSRQHGKKRIYKLWIAAALGLVLALFLLAYVTSPPPANAAFPGVNGKIAFTSYRDGPNGEIYTMNPDGTGQTNLTNNGADEREPAWSADGTKIAFSSDRDGNNEIYVMNADGSGQTTRLTNDGSFDYQPAWSPDGTKIAFTSNRDPDGEIFVMNADGSGQTQQLTFNATFDDEPSWSPDGTKIAYINQVPGGVREIFTMNTDGTGQTNLTNNGGFNSRPNWSPDGTKIAYISGAAFCALNCEVFVMNANGSGQTNLTNDSASDAHPAWSPDGTKIAFTSDRDVPNGEIYTMNSDGSGVTRLTNNLAADTTPDWRPLKNQSPVLGSAPDVTVNEGATATNNGTLSDPDGDPVTLAASAGTVTNNGDGTWSWSLATQDGPAESQTVTIEAEDGKGGTAQTSFGLTVSNVGPVLGVINAPGSPVLLGTSVSISAAFNDDGTLDTHTAVIDWGDSTTLSGTVSESGGSGTVADSHTYSNAGVYTVKVVVTDKDGGAGEAVYEYVVVYDPSAGFVTGGGWINSPPGAYSLNPTLTGKATFGFVSKYQKGASTPSGQTEFQFKAGGLNFHSSSYDWLVIAGSMAQYKGTGTINGTGGYGFMLTATDGQLTGGGGMDKFRIKIWDKTTGTVIYDNMMGSADTDSPTTILGGGSIVIHK